MSSDSKFAELKEISTEKILNKHSNKLEVRIVLGYELFV